MPRPSAFPSLTSLTLSFGTNPPYTTTPEMYKRRFLTSGVAKYLPQLTTLRVISCKNTPFVFNARDLAKLFSQPAPTAQPAAPAPAAPPPAPAAQPPAAQASAPAPAAPHLRCLELYCTLNDLFLQHLNAHAPHLTELHVFRGPRRPLQHPCHLDLLSCVKLCWRLQAVHCIPETVRAIHWQCMKPELVLRSTQVGTQN